MHTHATQRHGLAGRAMLVTLLAAGLAACGGTEPDPGNTQPPISAAEVEQVAEKVGALNEQPAIEAFLGSFGGSFTHQATGQPAFGRGTVEGTRALLRAARESRPRTAAFAQSSAGMSATIEGKVFVKGAEGWQVDPSRTAPASTVRFMFRNAAGAEFAHLDVLNQTVAGSESEKYRVTLVSGSATPLDFTLQVTEKYVGDVQDEVSWSVAGTVTNGQTAVTFTESYAETGMAGTQSSYSWNMKHQAPSLQLASDIKITGSDNGNTDHTDDPSSFDFTLTLKDVTLREVFDWTTKKITFYVNQKVYATGTYNASTGQWSFTTPDGRALDAEQANLFRWVDEVLGRLPYPFFYAIITGILLTEAESAAATA